MEAQHPTTDALDRFRRGAMKGAEVLEIGRHVSSCAQCRALARRNRDANADAAQLASLRGADVSSAHSPLLPWLIAASVIVVIGAAVFFGLRRNAPQPLLPSHPAPVRIAPAGPYDRAEWNALVKSALASGRAPWPDAELAALRGKPEETRGPAARDGRVAPAGVVVESAQPRFRWWPAVAGATYRVGVYRDERTIARSPALHTTEWTPPPDVLLPGVTYTWDVVAARDGNESIIPAPPAPPARFRVIDAQAAAEIEAAQARYPDDHLLLGLLYARSGVRDRAVEELRRYAAGHPEAKSLPDL